MFRLFRRKIIFVVKYFQRNNFLGKMIFFRKYFSTFGLHEKITNGEKQNLATSDCRRQIPAKFTGIWPNTAGFRCTSRNLA